MIAEQEKRNEERDDMIAHSMNRFLNAFAALAENSMLQGTSAFSNVMPDWNMTKENVAESASKIFYRNMTASRAMKPTSSVISETHNKCQRKLNVNQVYTVDDMDSSQVIIVNENDNQQISDSFVDDINLPKFKCDKKSVEQIESDIIDNQCQESMPHESEITDSTQIILNTSEHVSVKNQSLHKSNQIIHEPIYKKKNILKSLTFNKILPTVKKEKYRNILITKTDCNFNKSFNNIYPEEKM